MVVDTSVLVAILQDEPERGAFNRAIEAAERRAVSVASFVEASSDSQVFDLKTRWVWRPDRLVYTGAAVPQ